MLVRHRRQGWLTLNSKASEPPDLGDAGLVEVEAGVEADGNSSNNNHAIVIPIPAMA